MLDRILMRLRLPAAFLGISMTALFMLGGRYWMEVRVDVGWGLPSLVVISCHGDLRINWTPVGIGYGLRVEPAAWHPSSGWRWWSFELRRNGQWGTLVVSTWALAVVPGALAIAGFRARRRWNSPRGDLREVQAPAEGLKHLPGVRYDGYHRKYAGQSGDRAAAWIPP